MMNSTLREILNLADEVHAENAKWWTDLATGESLLETRNRSELLMLCVTEVAEAEYGLHHNCADDKLPHLHMFSVELADITIRLLDMIGAENRLHGPWEFDLGRIHKLIHTYSGVGLMKVVSGLSAACESLRKGEVDIYRDHLATTVAVVENLGNDAHHLNIINHKRAFNRQRADHKLENRRQVGGKKF